MCIYSRKRISLCAHDTHTHTHARADDGNDRMGPHFPRPSCLQTRTFTFLPAHKPRGVWIGQVDTRVCARSVRDPSCAVKAFMPRRVYDSLPEIRNLGAVFSKISTDRPNRKEKKTNRARRLRGHGAAYCADTQLLYVERNTRMAGPHHHTKVPGPRFTPYALA